MTKSPEKGDNEYTDEAMRLALRTGRDVEDILCDMLQAAKRAGDKESQRKIRRAQKYRGFRNKQKRKRK